MSKRNSVPRYQSPSETEGPSRNEILAHYGITGSAEEDPHEREMREWEEQQQRRLAGEAAPSELALEHISVNPENPRETLGDLEGLIGSLMEVGQVTAITVATVDAYLKGRPDRQGELEPGARFVVVDGHRRLAAAREAGLSTLKVTVNDAFAATDETLLEAAFVANAQREDLTEIEEAHALQRLVEHYGSQHKVAARLGLTQPYVSQRLSLLALAPDLQADLVAGKRKLEHVRGLAKLSHNEQREAADARSVAVPAARKARRSPAAAQQPEAATTAPADNAVIAPVEAVAEKAGTASADNAVIGSGREPATAGGNGAAVDDAVVTQESATPPSQSLVDWSTPQTIADSLRSRLSPGELAQVVELLMPHL
ncbi:ParB/RepB/Spo0J family partition protein [Streptomyces sp. NPDC006670]|uniref:ParB/RepB/Spo0J family partition protein n=1 Tax=Streptomyces sp. NPDC006670 TaxID=3154476 RepID=UPI0033C0FF5E